MGKTQRREIKKEKLIIQLLQTRTLISYPQAINPQTLHVLNMKYHDYNKGSPYTKEQIKRRSFWIYFVFYGSYLCIWVIFIHWLLNGGRPPP